MLRLRNRLLPLVSLRDLLQLGEASAKQSQGEAFIVVTQVGTYTFGIIVDRVFDTEEIVVKPVAPVLRNIEMFSGNTILGDGSVIMILDPNGIASATGEITVAEGVDTSVETRRRASSEEEMALLLFRAGSGAPKAVPLALVARLEDIEQDMPPMFTTILAEHITRQCGIQTAEAVDGEVLLGRRCYIAPGGFHMTVRRESGRPVIRLNQDPPENFCRPAVDPLLRSLAASCGRNVLAVILTGMGQDGMLGARAIVKAGGALVAQDEASSVVWGMPGAVAADGICNAVLPVKEIGPLIRKLTMRSAA